MVSRLLLDRKSEVGCRASEKNPSVLFAVYRWTYRHKIMFHKFWEEKTEHGPANLQMIST